MIGGTMILVAVALLSYLAGALTVCYVLARMERDSRAGYIELTKR
jgi:glycerol-3-phosphate acyltransferase PlsY